MLKLDHLTIPVSCWTASRDWYVDVLGLELEFEVPSRLTAAVRDNHDFTIFLAQGAAPPDPAGFALTFQVADVHAAFEVLSSKGAQFIHPPSKQFWGYGGTSNSKLSHLLFIQLSYSGVLISADILLNR